MTYYETLSFLNKLCQGAKYAPEPRRYFFADPASGVGGVTDEICS
jgi:hypothetical protein